MKYRRTSIFFKNEYMGEFPQNLLEARKAISEVTGGEYVLFLEKVLLSTEELSDDFIEDSLEKIPHFSRAFYRRGFDVLKKEIRKNKALLDVHKGSEKEFIIGNLIDDLDEDVLERWGISGAELKEGIEDCEYKEVAGGIPLVGLTHEIRSPLVRIGKLSPEGWTTIMSDAGVCCIFFPLPTMDVSQLESRIREILGREDARIGKHELHHVIWGLLERGNFSREPNDPDPEVRKAFHILRHELVAHILSNSSIDGAILNFQSENKEVNRIVDGIQARVSAVFQRAIEGGISVENFIYPILVSRNFEELSGRMEGLSQMYGLG